MKILEFDVIFLSYDEPNADLNYADLCNKVPWAKRVHGVKGSDEAHKAAARLSETDWLVTVDADNIVDPKFFNQNIDIENPKIQVYSWLGRNLINGLQYGNGGLKLWNKEFLLNMKSHEASDNDRAQVDFCWEDGYRQTMTCYSDINITSSPFQAWRAGFREGVKMTLLDGVKVPPNEIQQQIWWHNIHRLRMWSTVGAHEENGLFAVLGARMGTWMTNCTDWNYINVRDFDILKNIYNENVISYETDTDSLIAEIKNLGEKINLNLGLQWPYLDANQSKYTLDLYNETLNLANTYYRTHDNV
jgi:hypothetical protein